jgi:hypothetical protein
LLEQKTITENLIINMTWRFRYVADRPRAVQIDNRASSDPRWATLKPGVDYLMNKVKTGNDLTPHLSLMPHTRGFTPTQATAGQTLNWSDKDLLLNSTGFHHFHLGTRSACIRTDHISHGVKHVISRKSCSPKILQVLLEERLQWLHLSIDHFRHQISTDRPMSCCISRRIL